MVQRRLSTLSKAAAVYKQICKDWNEIGSVSKHCNYTLAGTVAYTSSPLADGIYANHWY